MTDASESRGGRGGFPGEGHAAGGTGTTCPFRKMGTASGRQGASARCWRLARTGQHKAVQPDSGRQSERSVERMLARTKEKTKAKEGCRGVIPQALGGVRGVLSRGSHVIRASF